MEEVHKKIKLTYNEVHTYWRKFWCHKWWSLKTLKMFIESIFGQFWWPSYLTSKFTSICVNLIMSIFFLWTSSIVHMFDYLTFYIFLTTWHFDTFNLNHLSPHRAIFMKFLLTPAVWLLDIWHLFDLLTHCILNCLSPSQGYFCNIFMPDSWFRKLHA